MEEVWGVLQRFVRGVVRRRKRLALFTTLAGLLVALPLAYHFSREPPRYETTAVVLLEARADRVPLFPEFAPVRPLPVQLAILNSRSLAETVVDNLPRASLEEVTETTYDFDIWRSLNDTYNRWRGIEPPALTPRQRALAELQRARMTFRAWPDKSGIVSISAEASRPNVAVDIVNTYIDALIDRTRTFNIDDARVSREFLQEQLAEVKRAMQGSEQTLRAFVTARGGIRVPDQARSASDQLSQTEAALVDAETNRKMVQTRLEALREKVEGQKRAADGKSPAAAPAGAAEVQRLRTQLAQLESSLLDLQTRYTEEHPRIRLLKNRIDEITASLRGVLQDTIVINPTATIPASDRVNFTDQFLTLEATYHTLTAREEALRQQAQILRQNLGGLSSEEAEYARLSRVVDGHTKLHSMLADKLTAARIREQGEMKVVKVIDPPSRAVPVGTQRRALVLLAASGAALGIGVAVPVAVEWINRKVETEEDVEAATGLPVLALVPQIRGGRPVFMSGVPDSSLGPSEQLMFTEAFRALRVAIELGTRGEPLRSLLVTSAFPDEGKSTVVLNLGLALNESGRRVVLADTDFLRPTLHRLMKIKSSKGLVEILQSEQPVEQAMTPVTEGLWLAQRGEALEPSSRAMLASSPLRGLIGQMTTKADFVICDSSPVFLIPDNLLLASGVDGVILVAKSGVTGFRDLARTKAMLEAAGARLLGVVLNNVRPGPLKKYYSRYYNSYVRKERK